MPCDIRDSRAISNVGLDTDHRPVITRPGRTQTTGQSSPGLDTDHRPVITRPGHRPQASHHQAWTQTTGQSSPGLDTDHRPVITTLVTEKKRKFTKKKKKEKKKKKTQLERRNMHKLQDEEEQTKIKCTISEKLDCINQPALREEEDQENDGATPRQTPSELKGCPFSRPPALLLTDSCVPQRRLPVQVEGKKVKVKVREKNYLSGKCLLRQ